MLLAAIVATSAASGARAQVGVERVRTRDGLVLDWGQDAVWRGKARRVAEVRASLRALGDMRSLNSRMVAASGAPTAVMGSLGMPAVLVGFSDTDPASLPSAATYDSLYFGLVPPAGRSQSLRMFYREMSNALLDVSGGAFGWFLASNPGGFYLGACSGGTPTDCPTGRTRLHQLFIGALQALDAAVDLGQYDNDGPDGNPNSGDDDGEVDVVEFVQPVLGGECGGPGIWAHRWFLSALGGSAYVSSDSRTGGGSIVVNSYYVASGVGGAGPGNRSGCTNASQLSGIGTAAHEFGHAIGLPDLYDTGGTTEGIGEWGLMGSGGYTSANSPAHLSAWSKEQLGWVTVSELSVDGSSQLGPVVSGDTVLFVRPPATLSNSRGEYVLLENKQPVGSDTAGMLVGGSAGPKEGGLLIWHVDSAKLAAGGGVNAGLIHGVRLVEADGLGQLLLSSGGNRGDAGDPYPGTTGNTALSRNSTPANILNADGQFAGFVVDSVRQVVPGGEMAFRLRFGGLTVVRASDTTALITVDGVSYGRFVDLLEDGSQHTIGIDSAQTSADGRTQFAFQSWSDGGARAHQITGSVAGDSISAVVSRTFRIRVTVAGTGTVSSDSVADLTAGGFVAEGSVVRLVAAPTGLAVFDGWSGDTAAVGDTLVLNVGRPYDLTARFAPLLVATMPTPGPAVMGASYSLQLGAAGGVGAFRWSLVSGALPRGTSLSVAGVIAGIPEEIGTFPTTVRVASGSQSLDIPVAISVTAPQLVTDSVLSVLLGTGGTLSVDAARYLDLIGNDNGRFDVGDFLAFVKTTGGAVSAEMMAEVLRKGGAR
jgi:M6 family metalloprotease-like protein